MDKRCDFEGLPHFVEVIFWTIHSERYQLPQNAEVIAKNAELVGEKDFHIFRGSTHGKCGSPCFGTRKPQNVEVMRLGFLFTKN